MQYIFYWRIIRQCQKFLAQKTQTHFNNVSPSPFQCVKRVRLLIMIAFLMF